MTEDLESIYRQHRQGLFTLALSILRSRDLAEDAVQEAFVRLVRRGKKPTGDPVAYVFAAVRNAALDARRKHRDRSAEEWERESIFSRDDPGPAERAGEAERASRIREAIDRLPEAQSEALILRIYGGLSFEQMAAALKEPMSTISSRYRRGLAQLKTKIEKYV